MATSNVPADRAVPAVVVVGEMGGGTPPGLDRIAARVQLRYASTTEELNRRLPGAEVALVWDFRSDILPDSLPRADSLRWVHVAGAGVDAVLSADLVASDIVVTNARGVFDRAMAETVATMMLMFAKDMLTTLDLQRKGVWQHRETEMLDGSSAVIVGAGGIGREIATLLRALGVRVTGVATTERLDDDFGRIHSIDQMDQLLPEADFVVLVVPLTDRTRRLFTASQFRLMKPTARLINVGRGELVDEEALTAALRSGEIAGASLDVFHEEPLATESPLWTMPQVLVSPHMSADFHGWLDALAGQFVSNLERWLDGEPLHNVVDKQRGYVPGDHPEEGTTR